ncbi:MAG TPA: hypothetical protein VGE76_04590 [Opitutaceae bacterium]
MSRRRLSARNRQRGAVLIVALLVSALIALGLASYLRLNLNSSQLAQRSFNGFAALNLAEAGTEEAVWSFNRALAADRTAWQGWTTTGAAAYRKFEGFDFGRNVSGSVKVYVDSYNPGPSARPKVLAQSSVGGQGSSPADKLIEVTLRRRSLFANGLVSKETITFAGAVASVDSWNSDPDNSPATPPVPYSAAVRKDNGTVGSVAVDNSSVLINQANIWGYVATGGGAPQVGTGGTVRGEDTAPGVLVDPRRVSTDFNADFDNLLAPTDTFPLASIPAVLGYPGARTKWRATSLRLSGRETLTILGDVTLVLTAAVGDALSLTGSAAIIVPEGSRLTLWVSADVKLGGNGLINVNVQPISVQLYGVNSTVAGQDLQIAGNGRLACVVYAPNGHVSINGNGDVLGSVVARSIRLTGNAAFHYDESLAYRDSDQPFSISKWREVTTAEERASYARYFQGW